MVCELLLDVGLRCRQRMSVAMLFEVQHHYVAVLCHMVRDGPTSCYPPRVRMSIVWLKDGAVSLPIHHTLFKHVGFQDQKPISDVF
jgi:hypothetical protein